MPKYWMITNRNVTKEGLGKKRRDLTFWVTDSQDVDTFSHWNKVAPQEFRRLLADHANEFPTLDVEEHENQKHVTLFVHGYNNAWEDAAKRYKSILQGLFVGEASLGTCVLFTWPSNGSPTAYLPDREDAEASGPDLAAVLDDLYEWLLTRQRAAARRPEEACKAKTSLIAHSMGNYVLQKAMQSVWTRKNQPLLVSLVNQLLMVAADVDNDLFKGGETVDKSDGDAIANLTYRITALYSGLDETLGLSAGLKHFGKRRLGRSGLDPSVSRPDNVWEYDCTRLFGQRKSKIHSAYFEVPSTMELMRKVLRGADRGAIERELREVK